MGSCLQPATHHHMILPLHERHILLTVTQVRFHNEATERLLNVSPTEFRSDRTTACEKFYRFLADGTLRFSCVRSAPSRITELKDLARYDVNMQCGAPKSALSVSIQTNHARRRKQITRAPFPASVLLGLWSHLSILRFLPPVLLPCSFVKSMTVLLGPATPLSEATLALSATFLLLDLVCTTCHPK